jgi:hypothetical protein
MFQHSQQNISFRQQIISLSQSYPCPRCAHGVLEPLGLTETFKCQVCERAYVPLRGGRFLHPAHHLGLKIAPTFWWDGYRWHWAGTTASSLQLFSIFILSLIPVFTANVLLSLNSWSGRPEWCNHTLLTAAIGLITIQVMYLAWWDFDFVSRQRSRRHKAQSNH